jgi:hypothetical protein
VAISRTKNPDARDHGDIEGLACKLGQFAFTSIEDADADNENGRSAGVQEADEEPPCLLSRLAGVELGVIRLRLVAAGRGMA